MMRITHADDNTSNKLVLRKAGTLAVVGLVLAVVATAMAMSKNGEDPVRTPLKDHGANANVNEHAQPRTKKPDGMVWIPGGDYTMGSPNSDGLSHAVERPAHSVKVGGFWMDEAEEKDSSVASSNGFFQ